MLKRNLVRTFLFTHGLFLLVLMPNINAVKGEPVNRWHTERVSVLEIQDEVPAADSTLPSIPDSGSVVKVSEMLKTDSVAMPEIQLNKQAAKYLKTFLVREEESLVRVKKRSSRYFRLIDSIFTLYKLPVELKYLAVIESDLTTTAISRVGAKGMWQFMPGTARDLGLKITKKYDERTHVTKSTIAAAKYLRDLYSLYGDWLLVMAAYNGGPGKVNYAIRKSGSTNFWVLQNYLPAESRGHVKRFIGTHYYFEGKGSITTLTKAEAAKYKKALAEYTALQQVSKPVEKDSAAVASAYVR